MTPEAVARTLYATDDARGFYLIPDGVFLPLGPLRLRSMSGALRAVDAAVARAYAIDPRHARRLMKDAITGAMRQASEQIEQLGVLIAVFGKAAEQPVLALDEDRIAAERATRIAAVLGIEPDEAGDREVIRGRIAELLIELDAELRGPDALRHRADVAAFQQRFQLLLTLAAEEVAAEVNAAGAALPLALREAFQDHGVQQQLRDVAVLLQHTREAVQDVNDLDDLDLDVLDGDV